MKTLLSLIALATLLAGPAAASENLASPEALGTVRAAPAHAGNRFMVPAATPPLLLAQSSGGLPVDVQRDIVKQKLVKAFIASDWQAVLRLARQGRALGGMPPSLDYIEGKALLRTGKPAEAKRMLDRYLAKADKQSPNYKAAIDARIEADSAIVKAERARAERAQREREAAERKKVLAARRRAATAAREAAKLAERKAEQLAQAQARRAIAARQAAELAEQLALAQARLGSIQSINTKWKFVIVRLKAGRSTSAGSSVYVVQPDGRRLRLRISRIVGRKVSATYTGNLSDMQVGMKVYSR